MNLTIARVIWWQFLVGSILAAVLWGVFGKVVGYSAFLGSLAAVIPNAFLALRLVVPRSDPGAHRAYFYARVYAGSAAVSSGTFCSIYHNAAGDLFRVIDARRTGYE